MNNEQIKTPKLDSREVKTSKSLDTAVPTAAEESTQETPSEQITKLFSASVVDWGSVLTIVTESPEVAGDIVSNSTYMEAMFNAAKAKGQTDTINAIFDHIYEASSDETVLSRIVGTRFGFNVGTKDMGFFVDRLIAKVFMMDNSEETFGPNGLKSVYSVMLRLPPDHVKRLASLTTDNLQDSCPSGLTMNSKAINIAYNESDTTTEESGGYADRGDAMYGMTIFDTTLAHEMGHVADKRDIYSRDPEFLAISEWKEYKSADSIVNAMYDMMDTPLPSELDSNDIKAAKSAAKSIVRWQKDKKDTYAKIIKNQYTDILGSVGSFFVGLFTDNSAQKAEKENAINKKVDLIKGSRLFTHIGRAFATKSPWMNECYEDALPTYQIHQGYKNSSWWSYKNEARTQVKKNSRYQFRDPGEDFAELYATYFMGDADKKNEIESQRKDWFERVVLADCGIKPTTETSK